MKKPISCPCCGGKVTVTETEWHTNYYGAGIFCKCGLTMEHDCRGKGRARRRVIEKWNRRDGVDGIAGTETLSRIKEV
jgi:hypothetical protein